MGGRGDRELLFNGYRVAVLQDGVKEVNGGDVCTSLMYLMSLSCILKND